MRPYSAKPLTDDQRREVLRVTSECSAQERHSYRVHLLAAREQALLAARDHPERADAHRGEVAAYDRAMDLLAACWALPELLTAD